MGHHYWPVGQARSGIIMEKFLEHYKRLRHRPFTAVSGVRFPHRSPSYGRLAQLGERLPYKQNVSGSIPLAPTT